MSKHTPGPWTAYKDGYIRADAEGFPVAMVRGWGHLQRLAGGASIQDRNAALIAAAPDLLEVAYLFEGYLLGDGCDESHELVVAVRRAIARTERRP